MDAVLLRFRTDLRARWRSWLALALLVGGFAGAVTAVVGGARRTDSSFHRFLAASKAPDVLVSNPPAGTEGFATVSFSDLAGLPGVVQTLVTGTRTVNVNTIALPETRAENSQS